MRKLINHKIRDTDKMQNVISREGNSNDCYSTYRRIMLDERDGTHYLWSGHFWAGLGEDSLNPIKDVVGYVEEQGWPLSKEESAYVESLLASAAQK